eukprot:3052153-Rhodomonas_salina.2
MPRRTSRGMRLFEAMLARWTMGSAGEMPGMVVAQVVEVLRDVKNASLPLVVRQMVLDALSPPPERAMPARGAGNAVVGDAMPRQQRKVEGEEMEDDGQETQHGGNEHGWRWIERCARCSVGTERVDQTKEEDGKCGCPEESLVEALSSICSADTQPGALRSRAFHALICVSTPRFSPHLL